MAANTKVPGPNFAGIMRHADARGNRSGTAQTGTSALGKALNANKITGNSIKIKGGAADTPSPTKSVITPSQPTAAATRGNVGKSGVKLPGYDMTPPPRKPPGYAAYKGKATL